jgi:hypothetical protein
MGDPTVRTACGRARTGVARASSLPPMPGDRPELSALELELLELVSMAGEPTTILDEEMLAVSPGRAVVEATLQSLLGRGLVLTERGVTGGGLPRQSDGAWVYEDDWWTLTPAGLAAIR